MRGVSFGQNLPGYEIGSMDSPGVVVIQQFFGVTHEVQHQAEMISDMGYRCLVPDLYNGKVGADMEEAQHLMANLDWPGAIDSLTQAVSYLKDTGAAKVGVVGFCMGGALAFCAAEHSSVNCAVAFYGIPSPTVCTLTNIRVPMCAHFGLHDTTMGFSDPQTADAAIHQMQAAGCDIEYNIYDAGHGFYSAKAKPEGVDMLKKFGYPVPTEAVLQSAHDKLSEFLSKHLMP